ncbi:MAG TPA: hypothetical protein PL085_11690 [Agriterribacter sp.]|nr:hypothetical protein [Agriterribacter sp.]HRQ17731.1 hypothetical protein [Agriterribacter sp.]
MKKKITIEIDEKLFAKFTKKLNKRKLSKQHVIADFIKEFSR